MVLSSSSPSLSSLESSPGKATISDSPPWVSTLTRSSEPLRMIFTFSSDMSFIGSYRENPYLRATASRIVNTALSRFLPSGAMPPSAIESEESGTILAISTSRIVPSPLHTGQAPAGELNENVWGAGSGKDMPLSGQMKCLLK